MPVVPTVTGTVSFEGFSVTPLAEDLFYVPAHYRYNPRLMPQFP